MSAKKQKLPEGIRRLDSGKYQARYPVKGRNGKVTYRTAGTFRTLADAKDARSVEMAKIRNGGWIDPKDAKLTVREWSEQWVAVRPSTNRTLRSHLNSRILPVWGDTRLEDVTALGLQHWVNGLVADGLMPAGIHNLYGTLKLMLSSAVTFGKLSRTPCQPRAVKLPKIAKTEPVILSAEDMRLLEANAPERFRAMIHLGCWAGLRMGELIALRWQDINLETGVIHIQQARKHDVQPGESPFGPPKNGTTRKVPVSAKTVAVLRDHRRDFGGGTGDLLFTTKRQNRPVDANNFRANVWASLVEACGFDPRPTPHDMRHGHAGLMVMQGMDWKVLSDRLGHHHPSFTMDRYGWARPDSHEVSIAALEAAMSS